MMVELGVYALAAGLCYRKGAAAAASLPGRYATGRPSRLWAQPVFRGDAAACPGGRAHRGCHRRRQGLAGIVVQWLFIPLLLLALKKGGARIDRC